MARASRSNYEYHGMAGTKIYRIRADMVARCLRPTHKRFSSYGGRGITVCPEWKLFSAFFSDMGLRPEGKSLDRIDNNEGYSKGNCRWADDIKQASNKRNSILLEACGQVMSRTAWASLFNRDHAWLRDKIERKHNIEDLLFAAGGSAGLEYLCQA